MEYVVPDATIARAVGQGLGVPVDDVVVEHATSRAVLPASVVLVHRDDYREREPDTAFPIELTISVPIAIQMASGSDAERLATIARHLQIPFMASLDDDDQDTMRLAMPDGELFARPLGDVDVMLSASDRERLDRYRQPALPRPVRAA